MEIRRIIFAGFQDQNTNCLKMPKGTRKPAEEDNIITTILKERYQLVASEDPDFIIASEKGPFPFMKYGGVRILFTREHFAPDFNVFDYAIGPDPIICLDDDGKDRYFQLSDSMRALEKNKSREELNSSYREGLRQFLYRIFDQDRENAYRRLRFYNAKSHQKCVNEYRQLRQSVLYPVVKPML